MKTYGLFIIVVAALLFTIMAVTMTEGFSDEAVAAPRRPPPIVRQAGHDCPIVTSDDDAAHIRGWDVRGWTRHGNDDGSYSHYILVEVEWMTKDGTRLSGQRAVDVTHLLPQD